MNAIGLKNYGEVDVLEDLEVPKPSVPQGREVLIRVKASIVNPVDMKIRASIYDGYPDYDDHVPLNKVKYQILGYDSSGIAEQIGSDVSRFEIDHEVYFLASPLRQGINAEFVLVDERAVALKPRTLSFEHVAGVLIINGAGGVGSMASQICYETLRLPVIIETAPEEETRHLTKKMGATHIIDHHEDIRKQIGVF